MLETLQKSDKDTNELIDKVREYLFSIGIRTTRERAWDILRTVHQLPYKMLAEKNPEIKYQGQGQHIIQSKHGNQLLVIRYLGKFELKGVGRKENRKASIKFVPSRNLKGSIEESVKVID